MIIRCWMTTCSSLLLSIPVLSPIRIAWYQVSTYRPVFIDPIWARFISVTRIWFHAFPLGYVACTNSLPLLMSCRHLLIGSRQVNIGSRSSCSAVHLDMFSTFYQLAHAICAATGFKYYPICWLQQLPSADCWSFPLSWWLLPGSSCYNIGECILIGFRPVHNSPATCSIVSFARLCMSAPALWNIRQHAVSAQLPPGTLVTWALISATVSKQPYNMCDVAGVCVPWCIFHQRFSGAWLKCVYRLPISSAVCSTSSSETASRNKVTCCSFSK